MADRSRASASGYTPVQNSAKSPMWRCTSRAVRPSGGSCAASSAMSAIWASPRPGGQKKARGLVSPRADAFTAETSAIAAGAGAAGFTTRKERVLAGIQQLLRVALDVLQPGQPVFDPLLPVRVGQVDGAADEPR